jgi:hypothetical protein
MKCPEVFIESACELVFERHIGRSFTCRVTHHDTLITSTTCIDTLCDFWRLLDDIDEDADIFSADTFCNRIYIDKSGRSEFSDNNEGAMTTHGFDSDTSERILLETSIEDGVRDLITHFVWVSWRHGFSGFEHKN